MNDNVSLNVTGEENSTMKYENNACQPELLEYLSSAYEVLRKIFSFLYLEDIVNAAEAFDAWKNVAEVTRNERSCIESFVISDQKYKMSKIWSESIFCICFATEPNKEIDEKIRKFLKPDGQFLHCISTAGVIGTTHDLCHLIQQKVRLYVGPTKFYFTALRIPDVPGAGVKTFVWKDDMDMKEFRDNFSIPGNQTVKCLLILMMSDGNGGRENIQKNDFIKFLQSRQKESFAVGGCVIDGFINYSSLNSINTVIKYVVFYGENVEASSTVLTADVKSLAAINNKIKNLKEMCPETNKGALFVFSCAGRQKVIRSSKFGRTIISKWEGETIQKHFPNTPVIGCFGYGEFGKEHPYDHDAMSSAKKFKKPDNWGFTFSTSIVYLGFKK